MTVYERRARVRAPLSTVFEFHDSVEGLLATTPSWMGLRVESVRRRDGETHPDERTTGDVSTTGDVLATGTEIRLSMQPFGVGPRQSWTSRIAERERSEGAAWFRDEMIEGPFPRWVHTHRFREAGADTVVTDRVEYALPLVPRPLSALGRPLFEAVFAYRHRRTRELLEADAA